MMPTRPRLRAALALAATLCALPAMAQAEGPELTFDLDGFAAIETTTDKAMRPLDLIATLPLTFPTHPDEEGRPAFSAHMIQNGKRLAAQVSETGYADDSVDGVVYRVLMEKSGDGWTMTGLGRMWICRRGDQRYSQTACP